MSLHGCRLHEVLWFARALLVRFSHARRKRLPKSGRGGMHAWHRYETNDEAWQDERPGQQFLLGTFIKPLGPFTALQLA